MTISRRDFLKFSSFLAASTIYQPGLQLFSSTLSSDPNAKNVLVILFDTLSASNINFYGYPRKTMPHLTKLLDRATVYHNHYANANYTTASTASLLTGRHVWEHLAIKFATSINSKFTSKSLFSNLDDYLNITYTHNLLADDILSQFKDSINLHKYYKTLFLESEKIASAEWFDSLMINDEDTALLFKSRLADTSLDGFIYSLLFPSFLGEENFLLPEEMLARFPRGVPDAYQRGLFILEDVINWIAEQAGEITRPYLGYFHLLPPHYPYNTRADFVDAFLNDGQDPPEKPGHPMVIPHNYISEEKNLSLRREYDEFILYVDSEFNRLFSMLDQQGVMDNTLVIFTSDHGEMFERKMNGHDDPYLFDPMIKIPLIIFEPGQTERKDIDNLTSSIDLLPTLLQYAGQQIPTDLPGQILPGFNAEPADPTRSVFALDARQNPDNTHLSVATLMMRTDRYKVIRYSNYAKNYRDRGQTENLDAMQIKTDEYYEIFDLENDPEELVNLALGSEPEMNALIEEIEDFYRENVEYPG